METFHEWGEFEEELAASKPYGEYLRNKAELSYNDGNDGNDPVHASLQSRVTAQPAPSVIAPTYAPNAMQARGAVSTTREPHTRQRNSPFDIGISS